jgi:hypothetical protein
MEISRRTKMPIDPLSRDETTRLEMMIGLASAPSEVSQHREEPVGNEEAQPAQAIGSGLWCLRDDPDGLGV